MKSMKITPPEGFEIDKENSTFENIVFKPIDITYTRICKELFKDEFHYITENGEIGRRGLTKGYEHLPNNTGSTTQVRKILALNMLINIAAYFNSKRTLVLNKFYTIVYDKINDKYDAYTVNINYIYGVNVVFKDKKDAQAVINNPNFRNILDTIYK